MSKNETWRTVRASEILGSGKGVLQLEYMVTRRTKSQARRLADGLLTLPSGERILIETKSNRLGYNLLGQIMGKAWQLKKAGEPVDRMVAVCSEGDDAVEAYCAEHNVEVLVINDSQKIE